MIYFASPLPNCQDNQYVNEQYNTTSADQSYTECLLDYQRHYSARVYFAVAIINIILIVVTTFLFIYCASGLSVCSTAKPPENLDIKQLKKARKRYSLQKRSVLATSLGAAGHLVFSTCMFLTQSFEDTIGCQLFLYGVIIGFYTWMFAFCIRAYRLRFLFRLNQLKVRYLRMSAPERAACITEKDYRWYLTNEQNKNYVLIMPYIVYCLSLCVILIITVPTEITSMQKYGQCLEKWGASILVALYAIFIGGVAPFTLWYLRNNSDAHGIRTEIWIDAVIGIPFFVLYIIWFTIIQPTASMLFYVNKAYGPSNWVVFFTIVTHTITVVIPLIDYVLIENKHWTHARRKVKSIYNRITKQPRYDSAAPVPLHVEQQRDQESEAAIATTIIVPELSMESLERTMTDPDMMNILQDLAIRDFSSENLLFYENYLKLEEKFKYELVTNRHYQYMPNNTGNWKKSPYIPYISNSSTQIMKSNDNNHSTDGEKRNSLSLEQFMSIPIPFKLYPDFIRFYETFIREGSPTQVNISYRARHTIDQAFHDIYKKNPELNLNTEGESSTHCKDSNYSNDDEKTKKEQEEFPKNCKSKVNIKFKRNSTDEVLEHQESVTLLDFNMFETARVEVCWNIFNSVYPKLVDMYSNNDSNTIDNCPNLD
jgi:hypothetical protein